MKFYPNKRGGGVGGKHFSHAEGVGWGVGAHATSFEVVFTW